MPRDVRVLDVAGRLRAGPEAPFTDFGTTCDSPDRLPGAVELPQSITEGDYLLFGGLGAYARAMATGFNGYGPADVVTVDRTMP